MLSTIDVLSEGRLVIGIGAYLIIKGQLHQGMLFANMILASRALQPVDRPGRTARNAR